MGSLWLRDNKVLVDADGHPIWCDRCPCEAPPRYTCSDCTGCIDQQVPNNFLLSFDNLGVCGLGGKSPDYWDWWNSMIFEIPWYQHSERVYGSGWTCTEEYRLDIVTPFGDHNTQRIFFRCIGAGPFRQYKVLDYIISIASYSVSLLTGAWTYPPGPHNCVNLFNGTKNLAGCSGGNPLGTPATATFESQ